MVVYNPVVNQQGGSMQIMNAIEEPVKSITGFSPNDLNENESIDFDFEQRYIHINTETKKQIRYRLDEESNETMRMLVSDEEDADTKGLVLIGTIATVVSIVVTVVGIYCSSSGKKVKKKKKTKKLKITKTYKDTTSGKKTKKVTVKVEVSYTTETTSQNCDKAIEEPVAV